MSSPKVQIQGRPEQIKAQFISLIDKHLQDLVAGNAEEMPEIEDFAQQQPGCSSRAAAKASAVDWQPVF